MLAVNEQQQHPAENEPEAGEPGSPEPAGPGLTPHLGLIASIALALGGMIGAGAFVALPQAALPAGAALPLAVLAGAAVATCNGLSAAELGVAYPRAGGTYEFGYRLLSPAIGFAAGWLMLLGGITASATYALAFAAYLQPLLPLPARAVGVALVLLALLVNSLGVRLSSQVNNVLVAVKIAVLLAFVIIGAMSFRPSNFIPVLPGGIPGLLQASALLFFAYSGYARPVTVAEEVRNPSANLPRAVSFSLLSTTSLYLAIAVVALGLVGPDILGTAPAPLAAAMATTGFAFGPLLISAGALVATASVLLSEIWGYSRLVFAMARRGDFPLPLARLSGEGNTPRNAVLATGIALVLLSAFADLRSVLSASSFALLTYYVIMNLAALRLPRGRRLYPPAISVAGLIFSVALALSLPLAAIAIGLAIFAASFLYFGLARGRVS